MNLRLGVRRDLIKISYVGCNKCKTGGAIRHIQLKCPKCKGFYNYMLIVMSNVSEDQSNRLYNEVVIIIERTVCDLWNVTHKLSFYESDMFRK